MCYICGRFRSHSMKLNTIFPTGSNRTSLVLMKSTVHVAWPNSDIYGFTTVLHRQARCLGIYPFGNNFEFSKTGICHTIVCMGAMFYAWYYFSIYIGVRNGSILASFSIYVSCSFLVVIFSIIGTSSLKLAIDSIHCIDKEFLRMGIFHKYRRGTVVKEMFLKNAFYVPLCMAEFHVFKVSPISIYGLCLFFSLQYPKFILSDFHLRLYHLSNILKEHFQQLNQQVSKSWLSLCKSGGIKNALDIHYQLIEACEHLNNWFSRQLVVIPLHVFVTTTMNVYRCVLLIIESIEGSPFSFVRLLVNFTWTIIRVLEFWRIIHGLVNAQTQANSLTDQISKYIIIGGQHKYMEVFTIHFAMKPKITFSAHTYFKVDYTLFFSMLFSIMTYVCIVLQLAANHVD